MSDASRSLSGAWSGRYDYETLPSGPVAFNATLIQDGAALSGEIIEPNSFARIASDTLLAALAGSVEGDEVRFVKTYTDLRIHRITYRGSVDAARMRISGTWVIGRILRTRGRFMMVRERPAAARARRRRTADLPVT